ncbi:ankyrin [Coprinopsis marcescibilis]|uniref:Ankyrin n=1 Tax=Coprinopsis marcescibilis TaxID=230819 RepID=A0A5C3KWH8_COPMA|nr:ankyrin [Coprinopsis marcescibilis]
MFLLASLQLERIQHCLSVANLRTALQDLPSGVHDMYESAMSRIKCQPNGDLAKPILVWVAYAHPQASLLIEDLRCALATCIHTCEFNSDQLVDKEILISLCCGLVTLNEIGYVHLIHYTAYDYLRSRIASFCEDPHTEIASTCAGRLLQCGFHNMDSRSVSAKFIANPLLRYSHKYLGWHLRHCKSTPPIVISFVQRCKSYPLQEHSWGLRWDYLSSFHVAALFNIPFILESLIAQDTSQATRRTGLGTTPLMVAARYGHVDAVNILLNLQCVRDTINATDVNKRTALMKAGYRDHINVVYELLKVPGVDVTLEDDLGVTALMDAICFDQIDVCGSWHRQFKGLLALRSMGRHRNKRTACATL